MSLARDQNIKTMGAALQEAVTTASQGG